MNAEELNSKVMENNVTTKEILPALSLFIDSLQIMTSMKKSITDTIISLQAIKKIVSDERKLSALPDGIKKKFLNYVKAEAWETVVERTLITEQLDYKAMQNNVSTKETIQEHNHAIIDANIISLSSVKKNLEESINQLFGVIYRMISSENELSVPTENIPMQYDQNFEAKFVEAVHPPAVKDAEQPTAKDVEQPTAKDVELISVKAVELSPVKGVELHSMKCGEDVKGVELPPVKGDNYSFTSCERCRATLCERCGATTCKRCGVSFCEKCGAISSK